MDPSKYSSGSQSRRQAAYNSLSIPGSSDSFMNLLTAQMTSSDDYSRTRKKETITQALEVQDSLFRSLQRDLGAFDQPEEEEFAKRLTGVARFIAVEKKTRERRQRQELERSHNMINSLLMYSMMVNGGGSMPSMGGMGMGSGGMGGGMGPMPMYTPTATSPSMPVGGGAGAMAGGMPPGMPGMPPGMGGPNSEQAKAAKEALIEKKKQEKLRKAQKLKIKEAREKKLYEKRKKEQVEATKREIKEREEANRRLVEENEKQKLAEVIEANRKAFEERKRKEMEEAEAKKRKEIEEKNAKEQAIRDREARLE